MMELTKYDAMCRAIDSAYEVDEAKDIRDKAVALEAYFQQAKNVEAERRACEIRLRAERKAGQLLAKMEKAKGVRLDGRDKDGTVRRLHDATTETLSGMGISKDQSSRWQALAGVPEEDAAPPIADGHTRRPACIADGQRARDGAAAKTRSRSAA